MVSGSKLIALGEGQPRRTEILIDGKPVPVTLRRHRTARRIIMRLASDGDGIVLTVPWAARYQQALDFAARQAGWIWTQRELLAETIPLRPGSLVPVRGIEHAIAHRPGARRTVWTEEGPPPLICVGGDAAHAGRRVLDWLAHEAGRDLLKASREYAKRMDVGFRRVTIRDQSSRWGSCSTSGGLSYSWRLILAPPYVLDYVAAHEVAHLVEMNHSQAFWSLVKRHCERADEARRWLKTAGKSLRRYAAGT
jgi:predicted metal-dependent hydrolase